MDRNITLTIMFCACILGPSLVMAAASYSSITALGRNPSAAPKVFTAMTITLIFIEALAIIAFLVVWQLYAVHS